MAEVEFGRGARTRSPWLLRGVLLALIVATSIGLYNRAALASWLAGPKPKPALREDQLEIFVAATRIPAYQRVQILNVKKITKAKKAVEGREYLLDIKDIAYRVAVVDIEPESPFKEEHFAPRGTRPGLSAGIPQGWGAVTFTQDEIEGQVAHMQTGDIIAVLAVWSTDGKAAAMPGRTTWVSRRARVLIPLKERTVKSSPTGGGQFSRVPPPKILHEITIAMPEADLVRLAQAQGRAQLQLLLLSGQTDTETEDIIPGGKSGAAPPKDQPYWAVEVIQGSERKVETPRFWANGGDHE